MIEQHEQFDGHRHRVLTKDRRPGAATAPPLRLELELTAKHAKP